LWLLETESDEVESDVDDEGDEDKQKRRNRTSFTGEQLETLEKAFRDSRYPDIAMRETIAKESGLAETKIQVRLTVTTAGVNQK